MKNKLAGICMITGFLISIGAFANTKIMIESLRDTTEFFSENYANLVIDFPEFSIAPDRLFHPDKNTAQVVIDFGSDEAGSSKEYVSVPGLTYDPANSVVLFTGKGGVKTICAKVTHHWYGYLFDSNVHATGLCTITTSLSTHAFSDGNGHYYTLDVYFEAP